METKIDGRKLTIEHFLNKRLKGEQVGDFTAYPMYVKVIFAQKTHLFRSRLMEHNYIEEDIENDDSIKKYKQKELMIIQDIIIPMAQSFDKEIFYLRFEVRTNKIKNSFKLYLIDILSETNVDNITGIEKVSEETNIFIELSKYIETEVKDDLKIGMDGDVLWFDWDRQIAQEYKKYLSDRYPVKKVDKIINLITKETIHYPSKLQ